MKTSSIYKILLAATALLAFSACQTSDQQIEKWIKNNPEKIMQSIQDYQIKQREARMPKPADLEAAAKDLFENAGSPKKGSGNIKIAYFFDFNCGHCKRQSDTNNRVLKNQDGKVTIVYKNLPVLGPSSDLAARAALAAHQQNKFFEFYEATYQLQQKDLASLKKVAQKIKLDVKKWEADLNGEAVKAELSHVSQLAGRFQISGTPVLIINNKFYPGRLDELEQVIGSIQ